LWIKYSCRKKKIIIGIGTNIVKSHLANNTFIGPNNSFTNVEIGRYSYTNSNTKIINAKIGQFTCIGSNVTIGLGFHPTNFVSIHPSFYSNNKGFKTFSDKNYFEEYPFVTIGNDVWIGSNVTILGNVTIGDGAIVAYGSIITKDVQPYTIVGGIPAKVLKMRFDNTTIENLQNLNWWDLDEEYFLKHYKLFHDPSTFIEFCKSQKLQ
jgi:acetyltransferase-like isoleucine patch superfamily enzyme